MPLSLEALLDRALVDVDAEAGVNMNEVLPRLEELSFAVIRGLVEPQVVRAAKARLAESFSPDNDRAATGEHPEELHDNFQKLSIGGAEQSGVYRPRCMRTLYNPIWAEDIYGLREPFRKMARIRNLIYGFDEGFAIDEIEDGFWTASRIHHYPTGGGFLVSHLDNVVPIVQAAEGINGYFQPILVMSTCGDSEDDDFSSGGGFFEYDNTRYHFERGCQLGDMVVYSGATIHGVDDIDIHKPFRQSTISGRLAGFVTLYRHFSRRGELDRYLKDKPPPDATTSSTKPRRR